MTRWACCLLTVLAIAGYASASCFSRARVVYPVKKEAAVEKVVVKEVLVPVLAPLYGAAYFPPAPLPPAPPAHPAPAPAAPPAAPAPPQADAKLILDALKALDARLQALEARVPVPPAPIPAAGKPDPFNPGPKAGSAAPAAAPKGALAVMAARCAACHEAAVSGERGGGLTLLAGGAPAPLTDRQVRRAMGQVYSGRMPPRGSGVPALTDEEAGTLIAHFDSLK